MLHSAMICMTARPYPQAAACMALGNLLFSGSIYCLTLLPATMPMRSVLGIMTPVGGLFYVAGWALLAMRYK